MTSTASTNDAAVETAIGRPFNHAPRPLGGEQLLARRVEHGRHLRDAVDLERERGAEDRNAVRVVGGAVNRVENPARSGRRQGAAAELFGENLMTGKASRDEVAEHALNRDIDFRDEVDGAFFFDEHVALAEALHLQCAGACDLDAVSRNSVGSHSGRGVLSSAALHTLDHPDFHSPSARAAVRRRP